MTINKSDRQFSVVVWGATGFTGSLVVEYYLEKYSRDENNFKWAIAGRSLKKLNDVKEKFGAKYPEALSLDILQGDANDEAFLKEVASKTQCILTTVGPYALYGGKLVQACVENGTNYCDLTGKKITINLNALVFSIIPFKIIADRICNFSVSLYGIHIILTCRGTIMG